MSNVSSEAEIIDLSLGPRSTQWEQYGIHEAPILLEGTDQKERESKQYKAILRKDRLTAIVSTKYTLYPNEEAIKDINEAIAGTSFHPHQEKFSRNGNAIYKTYLSDDWKREVEVGDIVQLGFMLRNSIDGSTGFGIELFSYRLVCKNGAVAPGAALGRISRMHVGDFSRAMLGLKEQIFRLMQVGEDLIQTYRKWTQIRINQKLAEVLAKSAIPNKYLPDYIDVTKEGSISLLQTPTLWTVFNDVTQAVWHNNKLQPQTIVQHTEAVHNLLVAPEVMA